MKTRIIKNILNKNERRCRDVKTQKACKQGWEANIGPKITSTSTYTAIKQNTKSCTYVGLYGGDFGSYVSFPTLFACFLGFDVPTSSFIFIENFIILVITGLHIFFKNCKLCSNSNMCLL